MSKEELKAENERFRNALAVFADLQSWMWHDHEREDSGHWGWNKLGDFADPREFARLALEGTWVP